MQQLTLDYFKIDMNLSKLMTGDIAFFENRQATLGYIKIDRKVLKIVTEDIAIFF